MKNGRGHLILGDPGAASREDRMFLVKVYYKIEKLFFWPIGSREFKCLWNWFGKSKSPGGSSRSYSKISPGTFCPSIKS